MTGNPTDLPQVPAVAGVEQIPPQTPLFYALQKDRYLRQEWIRQIEGLTGRTLIVYVADPSNPNAAISGHDIPPFADLLQDLNDDTNLDLLIHSGGGDIDAAERIVHMCRERSATFRVIVPSSAKSAATMIAIAADSIVMGYVSELGPIDPQVYVTTPRGETMWRPAQSFLDGLDAIKEEAKGGEISPAYFPLLDKLDPALIDYCRKSIDRAKAFAERWLKKGMCAAEPAKAGEIASRLCDATRYLSHGAMIDAEEADEMGLKVEYLQPHSDLWQRIWRLYDLYEMAVRELPASKIYESIRASVSFAP